MSHFRTHTNSRHRRASTRLLKPAVAAVSLLGLAVALFAAGKRVIVATAAACIISGCANTPTADASAASRIGRVAFLLASDAAYAALFDDDAELPLPTKNGTAK